MMADENSGENVVMDGQEEKGDSADGEIVVAHTVETSVVATEAGEAGNAVADSQKEAPILKGSTVDGIKAARLLLRALLKLNSTSRQEVAKVAAESVQTEDQRALIHLKRLYDEFLPALCTIRNNAVDRMVLSRPEDRAMLEAAAAVKPEFFSDEIKLPPVDKELRARLEELFPEKVEDPETAAAAKDKNDAKPAKRGRQPKAVASDPPQPTDSAGDDLAPPKKGRAPKAAAGNIAAAIAGAATPARQGRARKAADSTGTNQQSQEDPVFADSNHIRPLRRTKSKTAQDEVETDQASPEEPMHTDAGKARPLRRQRSKVTEEPSAPTSEEAAEKAADGLACEQCTYINTLKSKRCKMCSNPLAAVAPPAKKRARTA